MSLKKKDNSNKSEESQDTLISIVPVPNLMVDTVDIVFDMQGRSQESSKESTDIGAGAGWVTANIKGSIASHVENTRESDRFAKYHVNVHSKESGTPEGLKRVLEMLAEK